MTEIPLSFLIFTVGAIAVFLVMLRDSAKQSHYLGFVLVLIVLYDWVTETIGLQLVPQKYFYGEFPLRTCLFSEPGVNGSCTFPDQCLPIPVLLMEASILMAVMRTTNLLGVKRWARPFLAAMVAVNIDVILDPIASISRVCAGGSGEVAGLGFWTWFCDPSTPGLWFGVPLFNYIAWFADNFAFVAGVGLVYHFLDMGEKRPVKALLGALGAVLVIMVIEAVIAFALRSLLDISVTPIWQWSVMAGLLIVCLLVVIPALRPVRRLRTDNPVQWALLLTFGFYFAFCLASLLLAAAMQEQSRLLVVWLICFAIGATFALAPYARSLRSRRGEA